MTITAARDVRAWLVRRSAPLLLAVTTAGMIGGGAAWLAGADGAADAAWLATAACGLGYALWVAVASLAHGRVSVDVIALLALAGAIAVDELLAAAVISVMLTSGRTLEAWAAYRQATLYPYFAWVYTIGRSRLQPRFQPDRVSLTMIERIATAIEDLDSLGAVGL